MTLRRAGECGRRAGVDGAIGGAVGVVVLDVLLQHRCEVTLSCHQVMIEAFAA
jgi:hypothetical protein